MLIRFQGVAFPVFLGAVYLLGLLTARRVYASFGFTVDQVGFTFQDGVLVASLLGLVPIACALGGVLFGITASWWWSAIQAKNWREAAWATAFLVGASFYLVTRILPWFDNTSRALAAGSAAGACTITIIFIAIKRLDGSFLVYLFGFGILLVSTLVFSTSWADLPQSLVKSQDEWPRILEFSPRPQPVKVSGSGVDEVDGTCVLKLGVHEGLVALWVPPDGIASASRSLLVSAGSMRAEVGC
jgi:hypothetical protein